jgi:hypothetical protein
VATILPFGDPAYDSAGKTTFRTVGAIAATFTWSKDRTTLDSPITYIGPGNIPAVTLDGVDEEADTPDAAAWTLSTGGSDDAVSMVVWANITSAASYRGILNKWGAATNVSEWILYFGPTHKLTFAAADASANVQCGRTTDAGVSTGQWIHVAATYDGAGGATAMNTSIVYVNGAAVASTATNDASYVSMDNQSSVVGLGKIGAGYFFAGSLAGGPLGPALTMKELSAAEVKRLYAYDRYFMGV